MTWAVKPGASLADLATIDLRRITDVLQVDHASLFLRDPDDPQPRPSWPRPDCPSARRCPSTACSSRTSCRADARPIQRPGGAGEPCSAALATPLVHEDRAVGAVLVVTRRENRRLGAIDAQVIQRATRALVERFLAPGDRREPRVDSDRFVRDAPVTRR